MILRFVLVKNRGSMIAVHLGLKERWLRADCWFRIRHMDIHVTINWNHVHALSTLIKVCQHLDSSLRMMRCSFFQGHTCKLGETLFDDECCLRFWMTVVIQDTRFRVLLPSLGFWFSSLLWLLLNRCCRICFLQPRYGWSKGRLENDSMIAGSPAFELVCYKDKTDTDPKMVIPLPADIDPEILSKDPKSGDAFLVSLAHWSAVISS